VPRSRWPCTSRAPRCRRSRCPRPVFFAITWSETPAPGSRCPAAGRSGSPRRRGVRPVVVATSLCSITQFSITGKLRVAGAVRVDQATPTVLSWTLFCVTRRCWRPRSRSRSRCRTVRCRSRGRSRRPPPTSRCRASRRRRCSAPAVRGDRRIDPVVEVADGLVADDLEVPHPAGLDPVDREVLHAEAADLEALELVGAAAHRCSADRCNRSRRSRVDARLLAPGLTMRTLPASPWPGLTLPIRRRLSVAMRRPNWALPAAWYTPGSTRMVSPGAAASMAAWMDSPGKTRWTAALAAWRSRTRRRRARAEARRFIYGSFRIPPWAALPDDCRALFSDLVRRGSGQLPRLCLFYEPPRSPQSPRRRRAGAKVGLPLAAALALWACGEAGPPPDPRVPERAHRPTRDHLPARRDALPARDRRARPSSGATRPRASSAGTVLVRLRRQGRSAAFATTEPRWRPSEEDWAGSSSAAWRATPRSRSWASARGRGRLGGDVRIRTSTDPVGDSIFYREVPLPFLSAVQDPSRIRWRYGSVDSEEQPPIVLEDLPVCGNCHSFSRDGSVLGLDVDYGNDKGAYAVLPVTEQMVLNDEKIITWSDYRKGDGETTFGLLSQVSPDGRYVISTVKDRAVFVATPDIWFSQLFFPIKGILVVYDTRPAPTRRCPAPTIRSTSRAIPTWSPTASGSCSRGRRRTGRTSSRTPQSVLLSEKDVPSSSTTRSRSSSTCTAFRSTRAAAGRPSRSRAPRTTARATTSRSSRRTASGSSSARPRTTCC
jgi:hypothetical protein